MKIAIMQPYLFPYLGYFQLLACVDKFVVYDDVAFIKQGWIHRNRILLRGKPHLFTVPVAHGSSFRSIRDTMIAANEWPRWRKRALDTIAQAYARAPHFERTYHLVERTLTLESNSIAELARSSVENVKLMLGLNAELRNSSTMYDNAVLKGQARVLDICRRENAREYVNPVCGRPLYSREAFVQQGLELRFLQAELHPYPQGSGPFVPGLSVIDALMFNGRDELLALLARSRLTA